MVATVLNAGKPTILALDASTGAQLWTWPGNVELVQAAGDTIVATAWDGPFQVFGLEARTGKRWWSNITGSEAPLMAIGADLCVCPAAGNQGSVSAYNLSSSAVAWSFGFPGQPTKWPASITTDGDAFYVADSTGRIWQVSASGSKLAQFTALAANPSPLIVTDGVLCGISKTTSTGLSKGQHLLYALDASTGSGLWHTQLSGQETNTMVAAAGTIYVSGPTSDGENTAIMTRNARTGDAGWQRNWPGIAPQGAPQGAPLAVAQGSVLIGISKTLYALHPETGKEMWQLTLDGEIVDIVVVRTVAYLSTIVQSGTGTSRRYAIHL